MNLLTTSKPRVILAVDHPGWTFHNIASQVVHQLRGEFDFDIQLSEEMKHESADLIVCFQWKHLGRVLANNRCRKKIFCIYDSVTWNRTEVDSYQMQLAIKDADGIVVANQHIAEQLKIRHMALKPIWICEDGVCTDMFKLQPLPKMFNIGWCGNSSAAYRTIKGLDKIRAACLKTQTQLTIADLSSGRSLPYDAMPAFYAQIAVYACMSSEEGTPNPPLEAMASGRPVITTRCGIMDRIIVHGVNGYFCERDEDSLAETIEKIRMDDVEKMGRNARMTVEAHHWKYKTLHWRAALWGALQ